MTLFEQSYRENEYMKQSVHEDFLKSLQSTLPSNCKPIIVTDAGVRNTWFQLIVKFGWDFVGRVRHNTQYKILGENRWEPIKMLYPKATTQPTYLFETSLAKANSLTGNFYLYKSKPKARPSHVYCSCHCAVIYIQYKKKVKRGASHLLHNTILSKHY